MRTGGVRMAVLLIAALLAGACGTLTTSPAAGTFTPRTPNVLTVATTDIPSAGFWEGTPAHVSGGFEFELAKVLARRFGLKSVDIKVDRFNRIVTGHLDGADLALDLITPTAQRARSLTFSSPYLDAAPTAVTRTGTAVPDLDTARSLRWGAVRGTTFVGIIGSLIGPSDPVRIYEDTADMLSSLQAGHIDAVLLDMPFAVVTANRSRGRLHAVAQLPGSESIAAALPSGSSNEQAVDSALRAFIADGTIDRLLRTWVGADAASAPNSIPLLQTGR